jgi:hypothetical protein
VLHPFAFPVVSEWYQQHPRIDLTTTTSSGSSLTSGCLRTNPSRAPPTASTIRYGTERWRTGERTQARDDHQQSGDQKLGLAHPSSVPIRQTNGIRPIPQVAIRPAPMRAAGASCVASTARRGWRTSPCRPRLRLPRACPRVFPSRFGHNSPHWTSLSGVIGRSRTRIPLAW